jgi:hypothetical protein
VKCVGDDNGMLLVQEQKYEQLQYVQRRRMADVPVQGLQDDILHTTGENSGLKVKRNGKTW